jgi:DNA-binding MarR family transcriptional regulator
MQLDYSSLKEWSMGLDEKSAPTLIDHIGWRLWRLARQWKTEFDAQMLERGYPWITEARGAVIGHLRPGGLPQSALTAALGVSKQAVQQFIDELVAEGAVERVPDPDDRRGKIVRLTARGMASVTVGNAVKREIEKRYRRRAGAERFAVMNEVLDELAQGDGT